MLELDVEYPKELHNNRNKLSFLAGRMRIREVEKLIPITHDKKNVYSAHQKFGPGVKACFKIKKIHQVTRFEQSYWINCIMLVTRLRTAAKNEFEETFFELINNSVLGNTMKNISNHKEIKLVW